MHKQCTLIQLDCWLQSPICVVSIFFLFFLSCLLTHFCSPLLSDNSLTFVFVFVWGEKNYRLASTGPWHTERYDELLTISIESFAKHPPARIGLFNPTGTMS